MITHLYFTPDSSDSGIKEALSQSAIPSDAVVKVDPATGLVAITTNGVWRADKNGKEEGLGVPGWAYVETQLAPPDAKDAARITIHEKVPLDTTVKEPLAGGQKAVTTTRNATPPVGLALVAGLLAAALWLFWPPTLVSYGSVVLPPELEAEWTTTVEAWHGYPIVTDGAKGEIDILIDPKALDALSEYERIVEGYSQVIDGNCIIHLRDEDPLVLAHEVGHCIGLEHSWRRGTIMHATNRGWNR